MRQICCIVFHLKQGRMAKNCHSSVKCLIYGRRHYVLLCSELRKENSSPSKDKMIIGEEHPTEVLLTNLLTEREVYLKTITIRLRHKGKEIFVRALMDDFSHRSYVEKV
ncbi:transposable element Tc1 transposase [Trichonephila clavipes]|nr:transposable element Tc1 transposase [Trichonephila clavipes]